MTWKDSLLWPLSVPYGAAAHLRARAYRKRILKQKKLDGTVISVGNLTVGGTGKTPMVMWVVERLLAEGRSVGILTRGYRGKRAASGPGDTSGDNSTSDEVRLLKSRLGDRVAFGVGADRFKRGLELSRRGVKWFVLDDGFQHLQLARDADIVLIDAMNPFGGGHVLPAGRLREARTALGRADVIVITRSQHAPAVEAAIRRDSDAPIFYARTELDAVIAPFHPHLTEQDARTRKLFAFCGIGNPAAFIADLRDWGFQIAGHRFFPDHHRYTARDIAEIERDAKAAGAEGVVCTEKDSFNYTGVWRSMDLWVCPISMHVDRPDDFWRAVLAAIEFNAGAAR
ncbi:MAG: tetraacyldisaccharide 4'-kinase [Candidatus Acidiferrales bacterium]